MKCVTVCVAFAALAAVAVAVSPPFESRFAELTHKSSETICEALKVAAPKDREEGETACQTWSQTLTFSKEYHNNKCANLVLPLYLWAMDEFEDIDCDSDWFADLIEETKQEWKEDKTAVPGASAEFANYIGHKRIGLEVELASTRIFAYDPAQAQDAHKVGVLKYGHSVAKTAATEVGLPVLHVTLDGVAAEGTDLAKNKAALSQKFSFDEKFFAKDNFGYQGLIELVTGPVPNSEIEPLMVAMDKLFSTISEVTECTNGVVGANTANVPVFGRSVKFSVVVTRYNEALTALHATKYNRYKLAPAEYSWKISKTATLTEGYEWYLPCQKWTYNKDNQNNQVNYQIPLSAVNSDTYVGFYYNALNPGQMVYGEKAYRGCRSSSLAYAAAHLPANLKNNEDVKGLITLLMFQAHTDARLSMFMGDVTATVTKDAYDQLYKVNLPDVVRELPKADREALYNWWTSAPLTTHVRNLITLLRRPENDGGAPIFKDNADFFWGKVGRRLTQSVERVFKPGMVAEYNDKKGTKRTVNCHGRFHAETNAKYGDAVNYDHRPGSYDDKCFVAGLSKILPVYKAPSSAKLVSHVSIVVEARKAGSPLNTAFKTPVDFTAKPKAMTDLFELQANSMV